MKFVAKVPPSQKAMMAVCFVLVAGYAIGNSKQQLDQISRTEFKNPQPMIIDGNTVDLGTARVRVTGIEAPGDNLPELKSVSKNALSQLAARDGGMVCAANLFDDWLKQEARCRTDLKSYNNLNLSCRFLNNNASVGATMVAQGYAVDYRMFSGGAYVNLMKKAAEQRLGLWGVDYEHMRQLAISHAQVPQGCKVGTIKH